MSSIPTTAAIFISHQIEQVCADLKIRRIFSLPDKPRARGRIERFFRTVNQRLLSTLPGYATAGMPASGPCPGFPALILTELDTALKRFFIEDYTMSRLYVPVILTSSGTNKELH